MTTRIEETFVGIDVSKNQLDVAVWKRKKVMQYANDNKGILTVVTELAELTPTLVVLEASGGWEMALVAELAFAHLPVAVVNPTRVRAFARATGQLAKTDKLDARMLAWFAQAVRPEVRPLRNEQEALLTALITRRRQVVASRYVDSRKEPPPHYTRSGRRTLGCTHRLVGDRTALLGTRD